MSNNSEQQVRFGPIKKGAGHGGLLGAHGSDGLWDPPDQSETELHSIWQMMNEAAFTEARLLRNKPSPKASRQSTLSVRVRENLQRHLPGRLRKRPEPQHKGFRRLKHKFLSSHNWSGAIVPALCGRRFSCVAAEWQVPKLEQEAGAMISIWIGLGGWYPWSNSMPHMGTEHGWDKDGKPINRVWCQWWLGQNRGSWMSRIIEGVKIKPGDRVACYLVASGKEVEFHFLNADEGKHTGVRANAPRTVIASSAQWIVERPTRIEEYDKHLQPVGLYPIPPINKKVEMRNCAARLGPADHPSDSRRRTLYNADLVRVIDLRRDPSQERWPQQVLGARIVAGKEPRLIVEKS